MKHQLTLLSVSLLALSLTACGGSSDNSLTPTTTAVVTNTNTGSNSTGNTSNNNNSNTASNTNTSNTNTGSSSTTNTAKFTASYTLWDSEIEAETKQEMGATQLKDIKRTINGQVHNSNTLDLAKVPSGLSTHTMVETGAAVINGKNHTFRHQETFRIYQQPNSVVLGSKFGGASLTGANSRTWAVDTGDTLEFDTLAGNATKVLPTSGTYNYSGKSFNSTQDGSFNYSINFGTKTGKGSVTLGNGTTTLQEAPIYALTQTNNGKVNFQGFGINNAKTTGAVAGEYTLGIFGDNAEEVAGWIEANSDYVDDIGFGGTKK